jgi:hypothetical protein
MKIALVTTTRTTTTEPYTQLPRERIRLQPTPAGMIYLPKKDELQEKYPNFWKVLLTAEIHLRADPAQLDAPLLDALRDKVGIRLETDDIKQSAALLNLDEKDPVFAADHTRTKPPS